MSELDDIRAALPLRDAFDPGGVSLLGVELPEQVTVESDLVTSVTIKVHPKDGVDARLAVIFAYAFEGHVYRLHKPRIMVTVGDGAPTPSETEGGTPLFAWPLNKETKTVAIDVDAGTVKELVLDPNQPGNQSATTYHSHMQLSHRGGRLT